MRIHSLDFSTEVLIRHYLVLFSVNGSEHFGLSTRFFPELSFAIAIIYISNKFEPIWSVTNNAYFVSVNLIH